MISAKKRKSSSSLVDEHGMMMMMIMWTLASTPCNYLQLFTIRIFFLSQMKRAPSRNRRPWRGNQTTKQSWLTWPKMVGIYFTSLFMQMCCGRIMAYSQTPFVYNILYIEVISKLGFGGVNYSNNVTLD